MPRLIDALLRIENLFVSDPEDRKALLSGFAVHLRFQNIILFLETVKTDIELESRDMRTFLHHRERYIHP